MPEKKQIRIEKVIGVEHEGGKKRKKVVVIKKGDHDEQRCVVVSGGKLIEGDLSAIDIDDLELMGLEDSIEEEDENGHTVLKIKIPKITKEDGDADPLVRAAGVSGAIDNLESEIGALVRRAREQGYSWTQIGDALGTSKQAAWERFSGEE